jgi:signal transduction histidine kinase
VADNGIGIPQEDLPYIFDRFYRADRSRTRDESGGSGLGLSICKWIVQAHKGKIEVESTPGQGSTFSVLLPG